MKPRRLINLAAAVSLLLAVAIVVLWVRSYGRREAIERCRHTSTERRIWQVQSGYSSLWLVMEGVRETTPAHAPSYEYLDWTKYDSSGRLLRWFPFPPVQFRHLAAARDGFDLKQLAIAYWLLLPPTLVLPALAVVGHRRRRRRERGNLCPICGYDRRAHAPQDRCPECGSLPTGGAADGNQE